MNILVKLARFISFLKNEDKSKICIFILLFFINSHFNITIISWKEFFQPSVISKYIHL
jgi:hypothetical protein